MFFSQTIVTLDSKLKRFLDVAAKKGKNHNPGYFLNSQNTAPPHKGVFTRQITVF